MSRGSALVAGNSEIDALVPLKREDTWSVAAKRMGGRKLILLGEREWLLGRLAESLGRDAAGAAGRARGARRDRQPQRDLEAVCGRGC